MPLISNNTNFNSLSNTALVKQVAAHVKQLRLGKNWSQGQLATQSGLDRATISQLENGRAATLLTLVKVLRALDKLYILNAFNEEPEVSPLQMLKLQQKQRTKASPAKKVVVKKKSHD